MSLLRALRLVRISRLIPVRSKQYPYALPLPASTPGSGIRYFCS